MPDSGAVHRRKRTVVTRHFPGVLSCFACLLFLAGACPSEFKPLPPTLNAPAITNLELTAVRSGTGGTLQYHPAIHIRWTPPDQDSVRVQSYTLLRSAISGSDTSFTVATHSIPAGVHEVYDRIDDILPPKELDHKFIFYKIAALDTLDRPGDTSLVDTFALGHPPSLEIPHDTLRTNFFRWIVAKIPAGYRTHMILWGDNGPIWKSPLPQSPTYGSTEWYIAHEVTMPDSVWPLPSSLYYFGARVIEESGALTTQSIMISEPIYVP